MVSFDDRKDAFEKKEAMSAEKKFKIEARRNKLLGEWAASLLSHDSDKTADYIKEVIAADFEEAGDDDVHRKVLADLNDAGIMVTEQELRIKMNELLDEATKAIAAE